MRDGADSACNGAPAPLLAKVEPGSSQTIFLRHARVVFFVMVGDAFLSKPIANERSFSGAHVRATPPLECGPPVSAICNQLDRNNLRAEVWPANSQAHIRTIPDNGVGVRWPPRHATTCCGKCVGEKCGTWTDRGHRECQLKHLPLTLNDWLLTLGADMTNLARIRKA